MGAGLTLLDLGGAVALLLWGVHMVQSGISRAYGPDLRRLLATTLGNRFAAFAAGLGVTAILQSSTATALMMAGFCADRLVGLGPALAVMLGANVGTTLIVQLLSFNVASFAPVLVLIGVLLFRRGGFGAARDLARASIGLGLILMALHQLLALVTPYADTPSLRMLLGAIATQPVLDVLLAAVLTALAHSSVAVVLLVASLAARGAVPPEAAFALVLGANLGTAINPLLEGAASADPEARRLPLGNFLTRLVGTVAALALLDPIAARLVTWVPDASRAVADFHTGFNLILALIFLPLLDPFAALLRRLLPAPASPEDPARPRYLDPSLRDKPATALAAAAREALRMADRLEAMLNAAAEVVAGGGWRRIGEIRRADDILDRLNHAIRDFLASLDPQAMEEADRTRLGQMLTFIENIESAGDVIDRNLMARYGRLVKRGQAPGPAEREEASRWLQRLAATTRASAGVFMTGDARAARDLAGEKEAFREAEAAVEAAALTRLHRRGGAVGSAEEGVALLDPDLLRDLKRINGHLVAAAAYPVLSEAGALLRTRLRIG